MRWRGIRVELELGLTFWVVLSLVGNDELCVVKQENVRLEMDREQMWRTGRYMRGIKREGEGSNVVELDSHAMHEKCDGLGEVL